MSRLPRSLRRKFSNKFRYGCSSGKRAYTSEGAAYLEMLRINEVKAKHGEERMLVRIYRCSECGLWHHTGRTSNAGSGSSS